MAEYVIRNKDDSFYFVIKPFKGFVHITKSDGQISTGAILDEQSCFNELDKLFSSFVTKQSYMDDLKRPSTEITPWDCLSTSEEAE